MVSRGIEQRDAPFAHLIQKTPKGQAVEDIPML
jgi:hypothetical protein